MSTEIQETINRLRELDRKASPAPWSYNPWSANSSGEVTQNITYGWGEEEEILIGEVSCLLTEHDAEMIAQARNAIPALLAEIERLTEENLELKRENHLAWSKGHAAGWDCHIITMQAADLMITMQAADLLLKDQKTSPEKGA